MLENILSVILYKKIHGKSHFISLVVKWQKKFVIKPEQRRVLEASNLYILR